MELNNESFNIETWVDILGILDSAYHREVVGYSDRVDLPNPLAVYKGSYVKDTHAIISKVIYEVEELRRFKGDKDSFNKYRIIWENFLVGIAEAHELLVGNRVHGIMFKRDFEEIIYHLHIYLRTSKYCNGYNKAYDKYCKSLPMDNHGGINNYPNNRYLQENVLEVGSVVKDYLFKQTYGVLDN